MSDLDVLREVIADKEKSAERWNATSVLWSDKPTAKQVAINLSDKHHDQAEALHRIEAVVTAAKEWVASSGNPHFEERLLVAVAELEKEE